MRQTLWLMLWVVWVPTLARAEDGAADLAKRMACAHCHLVPGEAEPVCVDADDCGPPLGALGHTRSRADLIRAIRGSEAGAGRSGEMPSYAQLLSEEQAAQLAAWMATLPQTAKPAPRATVACTASESHRCVELAKQEEQLLGPNASAEHLAELYMMACRQGVADGCAGVRRLLDAKKAEDVEAAGLKVSCALDDPSACRTLGLTYTRGNEEIRPNPRLAAQTLRRARDQYGARCAKGDPVACVGGASMANRGEGGPRDLTSALSWLERGCVLKHAAACVELGDLLAESSPRNEPRRLKAYEQGCELGRADACAKAAPLVRDPSRAKALNERACAGNNGDACMALALSADRRHDEASASKLFGRACELGVTAACTRAHPAP